MICLVLTLIVIIDISAAMKTHFVYWNTTNPAFRLDNSDHIVDVNQGNLPWEYDQLHLICPTNGDEHHVIYSVSREEFQTCRVTNPRPKIVAICNKPDSFMYFTITFRSFSPTPGGMEFRPGQDYYFISTSTKRDIHRRVGGYCSSDNMRMVFRVADNAVSSNNEVNTVQLNLNKPREDEDIYITSPSPRVWSARVPEHRRDYIYYYKPWHTKQDQRGSIKIHELSSNEVLTALPFTSSSSGRHSVKTFSVAFSILITWWAMMLG